jgi:hypothetical protein
MLYGCWVDEMIICMKTILIFWVMNAKYKFALRVILVILSFVMNKLPAMHKIKATEQSISCQQNQET